MDIYNVSWASMRHRQWTIQVKCYPKKYIHIKKKINFLGHFLGKVLKPVTVTESTDLKVSFSFYSFYRCFIIIS